MYNSSDYSGKNIDCIQCSHYAVCRYKENMSEVRETINKMKSNNKNKNLDITVNCVYYVNESSARRAETDNVVERLNVTIPNDSSASAPQCYLGEYFATNKVGNGNPGV